MRLQDLEQKLSRYFLVEGSPLPLALFRMGLGFTIALEATHSVARIPYYTPQTFHFAYIDFISPLSPEVLTQLLDSQYLFGLALALGLLTRFAALGVLLTQGYLFFICQLNFRNHIYLMLLLTTLTLFSQAGRAWSIDAILRWGWNTQIAGDKTANLNPPWINITAQRLVGLQVCLVYFYAVLHKINPGFLTGYPLGKALSRTVARCWLQRNYPTLPETFLGAPSPGYDTWFAWASATIAMPQWAALISYLTLFTEGFLAVGLLWKPTRMTAVVLGIGLHLTIGFTMDIVTFGLYMTLAYLCFWTPHVRPIPVQPSQPPQTSSTTA